MSIPLVQEATIDAINTSIIAIKRNIERINMLLGLVDSGSDPDLSGFATKAELQDAITELSPVNEVAVGNMQSVNSNAVANAMGMSLDDESVVDITSQVTKYLGINEVKIKRKSNFVYLYIGGTYSGQPTTTSQQFLYGLPQKYKPTLDQSGFALAGYNSSQKTVFGRGGINTDGNITLGETAWNNGTQIRSCFIYMI